MSEITATEKRATKKNNNRKTLGNGKLRGCKNVTKIKRLEKLKKRFKNVIKRYRVSSTTAARFIG